MTSSTERNELAKNIIDRVRLGEPGLEEAIIEIVNDATSIALAQLEWIEELLKGERISKFGLSFPIVEQVQVLFDKHLMDHNGVTEGDLRTAAGVALISEED